MINTIVAIAAGGAIGAMARHGVHNALLIVFGDGFPWGTMIANIVGSFLMGVLITWFANIWQPSHAIKLFLITGCLGAFTTFSSFSLDFVSLLERSAFLNTFIYLSGSVIMSIGALFAGLSLIRLWVS